MAQFSTVTDKDNTENDNRNTKSYRERKGFAEYSRRYYRGQGYSGGGPDPVDDADGDPHPKKVRQSNEGTPVAKHRKYRPPEASRIEAARLQHVLAVKILARLRETGHTMRSYSELAGTGYDRMAKVLRGEVLVRLEDVSDAERLLGRTFPAQLEEEAPELTSAETSLVSSAAE
jgi:hypothetical protein